MLDLNPTPTQYSVLDLGFNNFLVKKSSDADLITPELINSITSGMAAKNIQSGQMVGTLFNGKIDFTNTVAGFILGIDADDGNKAKFYIGNTTNYLNWNGTTLTIAGNVSLSSIDIGSGFHVDSSGNVWWGASATYAGASIKISSAGSVTFTTGTFSGTLSAAAGTLGTITAGTLNGTTIQTATSGARITINESTNNAIKFYDAAAQVIGIGTDAGQAVTLALNSTTTSGIIITSAVAGFALQYTNSLSNLTGNAGVSLTLSGTSNTAAALRVTNNGTSGAYCALLTATGITIPLYIDNTGTTHGISIVESAASPGASISINKTSSGTGFTAIDITYGTPVSGTATGITFNLSGSGSPYAFSFKGSEFSSSGFAGSIFRKVRVLFPSGNVGFIYCYDG